MRESIVKDKRANYFLCETKVREVSEFVKVHQNEIKKINKMGKIRRIQLALICIGSRRSYILSYYINEISRKIKNSALWKKYGKEIQNRLHVRRL